jgi:hypothetical protein
MQVGEAIERQRRWKLWDVMARRQAAWAPSQTSDFFNVSDHAHRHGKLCGRRVESDWLPGKNGFRAFSPADGKKTVVL